MWRHFRQRNVERINNPTELSIKVSKCINNKQTGSGLGSIGSTSMQWRDSQAGLSDNRCLTDWLLLDAARAVLPGSIHAVLQRMRCSWSRQIYITDEASACMHVMRFNYSPLRAAWWRPVIRQTSESSARRPVYIHAKLFLSSIHHLMRLWPTGRW